MIVLRPLGAVTAPAAARRPRSPAPSRRACGEGRRRRSATAWPREARAGARSAAVRRDSRSRTGSARARPAASGRRGRRCPTPRCRRTRPARARSGPPGPPRSAMPAWAMIRRTPGVALDERCEVVADRRQPAAAVDQDRHLALDREREDGVEPLVADGELLGAGMELDPARAEVEAAPGLLDRALCEVEAHERDDPVGVLGRVGERAVVRGRECRLAVGLVEAERERAARSRPGRRCASISSGRPCIPSMSSPRCVCASKRTAPAGTSASTRSRDVVQDPLGSLEWLHRPSLYRASWAILSPR